MRDLSQLQNNFQAYLLQKNSFIQTDIISTEKISAEDRLNIYRDAYYLRLLEVFNQDYPLLRSILGEDEFNLLFKNYLASHPSQFRSVRWFGKVLTEYLQEQTLYQDNSLVAEVAKFEWLLTESFDESDDEIIQLEYMATIPTNQWPMMRFKLHAGVRRINFHWNVATIWNAFKKEESFYPEQTHGPTPWLIWRQNFDVQFRSLTLDEAFVLDNMLGNKTFSEICAGLCEWLAEEHVAMHAASLLKRYIMDGLITAIFFLK